jgi:hypothetical protein
MTGRGSAEATSRRLSNKLRGERHVWRIDINVSVWRVVRGRESPFPGESARCVMALCEV